MMKFGTLRDLLPCIGSSSRIGSHFSTRMYISRVHVVRSGRAIRVLIHHGTNLFRGDVGGLSLYTVAHKFIVRHATPFHALHLSLPQRAASTVRQAQRASEPRFRTPPRPAKRGATR